jgi:hypothetical protein
VPIHAKLIDEKWLFKLIIIIQQLVLWNSHVKFFPQFNEGKNQMLLWLGIADVSEAYGKR